jgi:hypothetical protein
MMLSDDEDFVGSGHGSSARLPKRYLPAYVATRAPLTMRFPAAADLSETSATERQLSGTDSFEASGMDEYAVATAEMSSSTNRETMTLLVMLAILIITAFFLAVFCCFTRSKRHKFERSNSPGEYAKGSRGDLTERT